MGTTAAREICIKLADGTQYCRRSPIRDCSCERDLRFADPFSDVPTDPSLSTFTADLDRVLDLGQKRVSPASVAERLRLILVIARLIMLPKDVEQAFIISSLDLPVIVPVPVPIPAPPTAQ